MMGTLREVQIPFLACILLLACTTKLVFRDRAVGPMSVLHRRRSYVLTVALVEGTLGAALLVTSLGVVRLANVVFFATVTSIATDLARRRAGEGCGCFGGLSTEPAGRRSVLRVALLTVAAIGSAGAPRTGAEVLTSATPWTVLMLAAEFTLLLVLSPEVFVAIERSRTSVPCERRDVPLAETYATLHDSAAWQAYEERLTSAQPTEVWRELCHRYVVYPGVVDGRPVEVVFAVPVDGRSALVRVGVAGDPTAGQDDDSGPQRVGSPA
jgi:hypothetical protein